MTALSAARATSQVSGVGPLPEDISYPVKGSTTIYAGGIVCLDATGYAVPGSASTTLVAVGVAQKTVVNAGSDGAVSVPVREGTFVLENATSTDACTQAEAGTAIYVLDDQTVTKTSTGHSKVGRMVGFVSTKVAVRIGLGVV